MLNLLLISDPMFRALNIPLSPEDRKELDRKIRRGEPVDPVISWKGYILTGYEQDDIFLKYRKSSAAVTKEMYFPRRSDAVAWLCHQQLKRTDLFWAAKAWLISRLYEALRDIASRRAAGTEFQYRQLSPSTSSLPPIKPIRESTAVLNQLGEEFHYHKETIRRYIRFGRQLDKLEEKVPGIRNRILTGDLIVQMVHIENSILGRNDFLNESELQCMDRELSQRPVLNTISPNELTISSSNPLPCNYNVMPNDLFTVSTQSDEEMLIIFTAQEPGDDFAVRVYDKDGTEMTVQADESYSADIYTGFVNTIQQFQSNFIKAYNRLTRSKNAPHPSKYLSEKMSNP